MEKNKLISSVKYRVRGLTNLGQADPLKEDLAHDNNAVAPEKGSLAMKPSVSLALQRGLFNKLGLKPTTLAKLNAT